MTSDKDWRIFSYESYGFSILMPPDAKQRKTEHCLILETDSRLPQYLLCLHLDATYDSKHSTFSESLAKADLENFINEYFRFIEERDRLPDQFYRTICGVEYRKRQFHGREILVLNGNCKYLYRVYRTKLGYLLLRLSARMSDESQSFLSFFDSLELL